MFKESCLQFLVEERKIPHPILRSKIPDDEPKQPKFIEPIPVKSTKNPKVVNAPEPVIK